MKKVILFILFLSVFMACIVMPTLFVYADVSPITGVAIEVGENHSLALKSDGTVWSWGRNNYAQLGVSQNYNKLVPVQISSLSNVISISTGNNHNLALKSDGTVWSWGHNLYGELGIGTVSDSGVKQVFNIDSVISIAAGGYHSLALKSDGTLWSWGYNEYGQLGNGTTNNSLIPNIVYGLSDVSSIACGSDFSLALKNDGTVWTWGYNYYGQLGDGTNTNRSRPVQVSGLSDVIMISAGEFFGLALKSDGTVWGWGYGGYGQLGYPTISTTNIPVQIEGLSGMISIEAGPRYGLAIKDDGTVWSWGFGDDSINNTGINGALLVAGNLNHRLILKNDGTIWASGTNTYGQLGNGTTNSSVPFIQVSTLNLLSVPSSPLNLSASGGNAQVNLTWDNVSGASGYNVKRAEAAGGPYTTITSNIIVNTYTDTSALNDTTYYYVVTAVNGVGESDNSNEVSATPQAILPNVPTNLTVVPGNAQVALSWSAVPDATGYNVKRADTAGGPYTAIAENITETAYTDTTVTNGTTYYYVVTAVTAGGESDPSAEVSATPAVSISAPANVTAAAGDGQVTLSWSAVDGVTGYNVKCATTAGGPYTVIASNLNATNYTDTNALNNVTYYYVVSAVTPEGESPDSAEVYAMPVHTGASRFILEITLTNGQHKEYDMSDTELNAFLAWFDSISQGTGSRFYIIEKAYGMGPYASRKDYLIYDKILCFEINEYYI